jgi:cation transporter-like permease
VIVLAFGRTVTYVTGTGSAYQFLGARTSTTSHSATNREVTQTSASAVLARGIANSLGGAPTLIR